MIRYHSKKNPYILNDLPPFYSFHKEKLDMAIKTHPWLNKFMKNGIHGEISQHIELEPGARGWICLLMKSRLAKKMKLPGVKWEERENFALDTCFTLAKPYLDKSPMTGKPFKFMGSVKSSRTHPFIYQHLIKHITELEPVQHDKYYSKNIHICKGTCTLTIYNQPVRFIVYMEELLNGHHTRYETNVVLCDKESGELLSVSYFLIETDPLNLFGNVIRKAANSLRILILKILVPGVMRKEKNACQVIEDAFLRAKYNPQYKMCRDKLLKDMEEIEREL